MGIYREIISILSSDGKRLTTINRVSGNRWI
jgi:hypothetical protein